jgi:hypothetical protein
MKVHISVDSKPQKGYLNIRSQAVNKESDDEVVVVQNLFELNEHLDDSECDEIVIDHVLDYLPFTLTTGAIKYWISKLRKNGEITIQSTELVSVARGIGDLNFNPSVGQRLLYGESGTKKNCCTIFQVLPILKEAQLKIVKRKTSDYTFIVTGRRE